MHDDVSFARSVSIHVFRCINWEVTMLMLKWNASGERWKENVRFPTSKVLCAPCILLYRHIRMAAKTAQSPRWEECGVTGCHICGKLSWSQLNMPRAFILPSNPWVQNRSLQYKPGRCVSTLMQMLELPSWRTLSRTLLNSFLNP